jgi:hypothetical protein
LARSTSATGRTVTSNRIAIAVVAGRSLVVLDCVVVVM